MEPKPGQPKRPKKIQSNTQAKTMGDHRDLKGTRKPKKAVSSKDSQSSESGLEKTKKKSPPKKKAPPKKKSPPKEPRINKGYALDGELHITTVETKLARSVKLPFTSTAMYVDVNGDVFRSSTLEVDLDGKLSIVALEPRQVELLLELLGMVNG